MNQMATILGMFASPPNRQGELLQGLPKDQGANDFYTNLERNPLLVTVLAFNGYFGHRDYESWYEYLERLGLPEDYDPTRTSIDELAYLLNELRPTEIGIWTRKALERKPVWRLVRRLAVIVLAENGWPEEVSVQDASSLVQTCTVRLQNDWNEFGRPW